MIYRLVARYRRDPRTSSLLSETRGRKKGSIVLDSLAWFYPTRLLATSPKAFCIVCFVGQFRLIALCPGEVVGTPDCAARRRVAKAPRHQATKPWPALGESWSRPYFAPRTGPSKISAERKPPWLPHVRFNGLLAKCRLYWRVESRWFYLRRRRSKSHGVVLVGLPAAEAGSSASSFQSIGNSLVRSRIASPRAAPK